MKANELMVGDWVLFATRPTKINGIALGGFSIQLEHEGWQPISAIEPIPITPEILKENGFINGEFYAESHIEDWQIMSDGSHLAARSERGWCIDIPCRYVHELQHALHLCGIDYEIKEVC